MPYHALVRPLLFRLDPERVHHATLQLCAAVGASRTGRALVARTLGTPPRPRLASTVAGIAFPNPVGLAAGYDKNGDGVDVLGRMGFGFLDIGSVSNAPSLGNDTRPRLFRLPLDRGLMVFYGVPNDGAPTIARRLADRAARRGALPVPLGVTLVETNTGRPNSAAEVIAEVAAAAEPFLGLADMFFISAACANDVTGTHPFSDLDNVQRLFERIGRYPNLPPVFLKVDASIDQIERIVEIARAYPFIRGFRPSATAPRPYDWMRTPRAQLARMPGTATGPFLRPILIDVLREWYRRIDPARHVLLAHGGIWSGADAYAAIRAGASLVGLVTALVYEGPGIAKRITAELSALLERDGYANVADAVGADHRTGSDAHGAMAAALRSASASKR